MQKKNLGVTMKLKFITSADCMLDLRLLYFSPVEPVEALVTVRLLVLFLEGPLVEL